jgi:hypothetical protein
MVWINGREHVTLVDVACKLGIGYRAAHNYLTSHTTIPRQKIGRQYFVVYEDFSEHPRYVKRSGVLV